MKLYDYYRSTASYRVRIALQIKNIHYEKIPIHLIDNGGEQHSDEYARINPQELIPTLYENGHIVTQSLAIIEYLEEICPLPALLPKAPLARSYVRSLAMIVVCDMHPINNLRILNYLRIQLKLDEKQINTWYHNWLKLGFDAFETSLQKSITHNKNYKFCYGDDVTLADICLIPQVYNAKRFNFSMEQYPLINAINKHCLTLAAFRDTAPEIII